MSQVPMVLLETKQTAIFLAQAIPFIFVEAAIASTIILGKEILMFGTNLL